MHKKDNSNCTGENVHRFQKSWCIRCDYNYYEHGFDKIVVVEERGK